MRTIFVSIIFLVFCLISYGQEVTLSNLTQYIEFWPSEIKTTKEVILSNGVTIPPNTRSEILEVSGDGITISNQVIRDNGFFKYVTQPDKDLAGTIHPNVKYVDAEQFTYFRHGYCTIRKGDKNAIINSKGEVVRPWQPNPALYSNELKIYFHEPVYDSKGSYIPYTVNTLCWGNAYPVLSVTPNFALFDNLIIYSETIGGKVGYMRPNGEKLTTTQYTSATPFINNYALVTTLKGVHLINKKFEIITPDVLKSFNHPSGQYVNFNEPLNYNNQQNLSIILISELIPVQDNNYKWGYYDKQGRVIVSHQFDDASIFSEGLACVGKRDKFGEMYYGFINTKGKYIIEPKFRIKPGDFHCGRAVVMPYNGDGSFVYGYINKNGDLVIKVNSIEKSTRHSIDFDCWLASFHDGIAYSLLESQVIIDTTGKFYDLRKYPIGLGGGFNYSTEVKGQQIVMNKQLLFTSGGVAKKYGIMDIDRNILLPAIFDCLSTFDTYSGLAFASYKDGNKIYNGFINQQGQFVLLKKDDQATW